MKIHINQPVNPADDYQIYYEGKRLSHPKNSVFSHFWSDLDISLLLGATQYTEFENGKYEFNIPNWKINILTFKKAAANNEQLKFISQFI